jgi:hypothetical protein
VVDQEKFYDDEIAPDLRRIAEYCAKRGMSFAAAVQFADEGLGSTVKLAAAAHPCLRMTAYAARSKGNADALIWSIQKDGREHGHNSVCLQILERH